MFYEKKKCVMCHMSQEKRAARLVNLGFSSICARTQENARPGALRHQEKAMEISDGNKDLIVYGVQPFFILPSH